MEARRRRVLDRFSPHLKELFTVILVYFLEQRMEDSQLEEDFM